METYLVGGAVRDALLGLAPEERDWVVVGAGPADMLARGYRQVGKDFPVFLHPDTQEEYALARTERKTAPGYTGFEFHAGADVSLEEDLKRRDLTINAMARGADGVLVDPYGGEADLRAGLLRHVSPAFAEDPVRILRVARFAARFGKWGFHVAHETNRLMREMVTAGEVDALVAERVWKELHGALGTETPALFFKVLRGCGALAKLFPEIDRLYGVPQPAQHHGEIDTGIHTMMVLEQAAKLSPDVRVRFAALVHDLGKGGTPEQEWPRHIAHETRGVKLVEALCDRYRIPNDFRELGVLASRYHLHVHRAEELRTGTLLDVLESLDAFRRPDRFAQFLLVCEADARGRKGREDADYPQADLFRRVFQAAREVDAAAIAARGLQGAEVKQALRDERLRAIKRARNGAI